jgi:hypothetical protein
VEIVYASGGAITSVGSGVTQSNLFVTSGETLTVYAGGTIVDASILAGGSAIIQSGGADSASTVVSGGSETVLGSVKSDSVLGSQTLTASGATATNESVGGGGTVMLSSPQATLSGGFTFDGAGTLDVTAPSSSGYGDQAVISGFSGGDTIDLPSFGSGTTLSTTSSGGNTVATVSSGGATETFIFSGSVASNLKLTSNGTGEEIAYASTIPTTSSYTPGDLVLSIYGDGAGTGSYSENQAAPIVLQEITQTGTVVSQLVLPQTTTVVNGVTEYAISGEYASSSEGLLTLSVNGQSLTIAGYGIAATTFDVPDATAIYGNSALAQTTSLLDSAFTPVPRVIADISYNATIDTSTALYNVFDTNNPRSVITINGTSFYISGQGSDNDGTEGVFLAEDGGAPTPIYNTTTDTRDLEINNGQLYVSIDSKLNDGGGVYTFGTVLPTSATTPTELAGIGPTVTLTSGTANGVDNADIGSSVYLSPEQYFFADATTLYIADDGIPKEGGLGDGGLQKWSLVDGTWVLDYTLSEGLDLVPNTDAHGTTGLIGLTGTVEGNNVILYATNQTADDTDQTYLFAITDSLSATMLPTSESFTVLETAAPDTIIRGVSFAPTSTSTIPEVTSTLTVSSGVTSTGLTVASGGEVIVLAGGKISGFTVLSGGSAVISSGGKDSGTTVAHGASELVLGSATGDYIVGTQTVSNATAVVTSETIGNGGSLDLELAGAIANGTTVLNGGTLNINGHAFADGTTDSGGVVDLQSPKATLSGGFDFVGNGGTIIETAVVSAGYGGLAVITGFTATDVIDDREMGSGATLSVTSAGSTTTATLISGTTSETFLLAGTSYGSCLMLTSDGFGGEELIYTPPATSSSVITVSSGMTSTGISATTSVSIVVLGGGTLSSGTISSGGSATISSGGVDSATTVLSGGYEVVSGSATGDQIYGIQNVSGASEPAKVSSETVYNGGTVELFLKPDIGSNITVSSGGSLLLNGNVSAVNTVLEGGALIELQSPKATLTGALTFSGAATLEFTATTSAGYGDNAVISGFTTGDIIDETTIAPGAALGAPVVSGGVTSVTISGTGTQQTFTFAGTAIGPHLVLMDDDTTGVELVYMACFRAGTRIATVAGEIAVEDLAEGDLVRTVSGAARPVRWIGRRRLNCARQPDPARVWPVRVAAGAFGQGLPKRDLYLSPDHAVLVDGALIAIRQLVNGVTIAPVAVGAVTYFHIELDRHDVLLAEGLPAESYLDTGNRGEFENAGLPTVLHPTFSRAAASRLDDACAPLVTDPARVEPVWRRLAARAGVADRIVETTNDPALRLVVGGRQMAAVSAEAGRHVFVLPPRAGATAAQIMSRSMVPADVRPWLDDRRRLGVPISRIVLRGRGEVTDLPLDHPTLAAGWHAVERNWRWTDGAAWLDVPAATVMVELRLAWASEYPLRAVGETRLPAQERDVFGCDHSRHCEPLLRRSNPGEAHESFCPAPPDCFVAEPAPAKAGAPRNDGEGGMRLAMTMR